MPQILGEAKKVASKIQLHFEWRIDNIQPSALLYDGHCNLEQIQIQIRAFVVMDRPKRVISWLETFPPDIWAYFALYLPGDQLGRLMMTGATVLRQRLKSPTVVKSVKLGTDFLVFKSFPRFLNDFPSLEELSIYKSEYQDDIGRGLTIGSIPSGVKKLELSGNWGKCPPLLFGEDGSTMKLMEQLPHIEVLSLKSLDFANHAWTTHAPQSLTELRLKHWNGEYELPSSLLTFTSDGVGLSAASFVSKLPCSLESFLVWGRVTGVELLLPVLPATTHTLRCLTWSDDSNGLFLQRAFDQLPKSLTVFEIPTLPERIDFYLQTNPEVISLLPPGLIELSCNPELPISAWPLLPQRLTRLYFRAPSNLHVTKMVEKDGIYEEVQLIPFDLLPRSLTILALHSFDSSFCGLPSTIHSYFPPHLTELRLRGVHLSPSAAKLLPASLTALDIGSLCERVCEHLPNSLKELIAHQTLLSPNLFKFLPKSLTTLYLTNPPPGCYSWFDFNTGKLIDSWSKLPGFSIHKKCLSRRLDWRKMPRLPPTLTELSIGFKNGFSDSFLTHLPNLIQLHLRKSINFSDACISSLYHSPRLQWLSLGSSPRITGASFRFLPRCLTHLELDSSESIFDSDILHLPRTLEYVTLCRAIHLTDLCVPDLPPHLNELDLSSNSLITPLSFPHFPYPLRSSECPETVQCLHWYLDRGKIHHKVPATAK